MANQKTRLSKNNGNINQLKKRDNKTIAYNTNAADSTYKPSAMVTDPYKRLNKQLNSGAPTFNSQYTNEMANAYQKYKNRGPFEYDMNNDALYQQYAKQYRALGNQAMQDTMGQAAQLSGGFGNSYATTAGQQAYNSYLNELNNIVPQLYSQAYDKYNQEGQDILNTYNLAQQQYNNDFSKFQSDLDQYNTNINQLMDLYNTNANNDINIWQQNAANNQWALNYALEKENQAFNQAQALRDYELDKAQTYANIANTKANTKATKIANSAAKKASKQSGGSVSVDDLEKDIYTRLEGFGNDSDALYDYLEVLKGRNLINNDEFARLYNIYNKDNKSNNKNVDMSDLEQRAKMYGQYSDSNAIENLLRTAVDNQWIDNNTAEKWYKKYHK